MTEPRDLIRDKAILVEEVLQVADLASASACKRLLYERSTEPFKMSGNPIELAQSTCDLCRRAGSGHVVTESGTENGCTGGYHTSCWRPFSISSWQVLRRLVAGT